MQCKDIPDKTVLQFLQSLNCWGTLLNGYDNSVQNAMPPGVNTNLALAKMRTLKRKGLVTGCFCGCRGDFELTEKGTNFVNQ